MHSIPLSLLATLCAADEIRTPQVCDGTFSGLECVVCRWCLVLRRPRVCRDYTTAAISDRLKALLAIAEQVQIDGKRVTAALVDQARQHGATDLHIHDTVLIAAAFCMYNRYVDGLGTWQPREDAMYLEMGRRMAEHGYAGAPR